MSKTESRYYQFLSLLTSEPTYRSPEKIGTLMDTPRSAILTHLRHAQADGLRFLKIYRGQQLVNLCLVEDSIERLFYLLNKYEPKPLVGEPVEEFV